MTSEMNYHLLTILDFKIMLAGLYEKPLGIKHFDCKLGVAIIPYQQTIIFSYAIS